MKRILVLFLCIPFLSSFLMGQWKSKEVYGFRTDSPINVDGLLDEPIWESAPEATDFIQLEPEKGNPASERTVVKILFDDKYIYFGFWCYDAEPEKIVGRMTKRDTDIRSDDSVFVVLDTFHDRRTSYYLGTNLLGTQLDGRISENGRTTNPTWDGIWKSAAQQSDFGWTAEFAVDLSSIKYVPGMNMTWGLSLSRIIPRKLESSLWTGPLESAFKVSQFGELKGLNLKKAEKKSRLSLTLFPKRRKGKKRLPMWEWMLDMPFPKLFLGI